MISLLCMMCAVEAAALEPLTFEVEDWTEPQAWVVNSDTKDRWNLWSKDKDAHKKWSEGITLRSPLVMKDRQSPEEGAPPLHTKITGIPKGTYDVTLHGTRNLAVSRDGSSWKKYTNGTAFEGVKITNGVFEMWVDDRYTHPGNPGACYYDFIKLSPYKVVKPKPKVAVMSSARVEEKLDRGFVAIHKPEGVYLSWRLLKDDPPDLGFDIFRDGKNLNEKPITGTTDFFDSQPGRTYVLQGSGTDILEEAQSWEGAYQSIPLQGDYTVQKVGLGDLDGDGAYDYVLKQPGDNIDPYSGYWKRSPETYKIEAYDSSGKFLWRNDLGWAIERGIWYSPYIVYDFDGDGKAEVAAKIGEGDPRDPDGRVRKGPEWLVVWDGLTGKERARVPWPDRSGFNHPKNGYNRASRNQLAVAYLDGKTPCLIALRGTYDVMKVQAFVFRNNQLSLLWKYRDSEGGRAYHGQGAHFTHAADVDGDGRDELILGSAVLDDNGSPLWSTRLGHPDHAYIGDVDPVHPGLEIYYGIEMRQNKNGMCLVAAATGEILWGWTEPTRHVHSYGMCSDIDPIHPGMEGYSADTDEKKKACNYWLWSADGKILRRDLKHNFGRRTAHWDADLQREFLLGENLMDYEGETHLKIKGRWVLTADVFGDWREEIFTSLPGELRIYTTTIPAMDRRVCLMQDPIYRLDTAMNAMGYPQVPMTSYCLADQSPNLNLTRVAKDRVRVVLSAPGHKGLSGFLNFGDAHKPVEVVLKPRGRYTVEISTAGPLTAEFLSKETRLHNRI